MTDDFRDIPEILKKIQQLDPRASTELAALLRACGEEPITPQKIARCLVISAPYLPEIPELYEIAKKITLEMGWPWYDPRTGERFDPK